jgi:hypothetical protein
VRHAKVKLFTAAWLAGLPGVVAVTWLVLPGLIEGRSLPIPLWAVQVAGGAQSALLLALAVFIGVALASEANLKAPALSALADGEPIVEALQPQLLPGLVGGIVGAAILWVAAGFTPEALLPLQAKFSMPVVARLLYGGVTEELVVRWGLMTLLVWLFWRFGEGGVGIPSGGVVFVAIGVSAVLFGMAHLPAASAMIGQVSAGVGAYIVIANAAFGLVAGWLYWRFGLEAAILAHTLAHAVFLLVSG